MDVSSVFLAWRGGGEGIGARRCTLPYPPLVPFGKPRQRHRFKRRHLKRRVVAMMEKLLAAAARARDRWRADPAGERP